MRLEDMSGSKIAPAVVAAAAIPPHTSGHRVADIRHLHTPDTPTCPLIWFSHFPVISHAEAASRHQWPCAGDLANRASMEQLLRGHGGPVVVLSGHLLSEPANSR